MRRILLDMPGLGFKISGFSVLFLLACFGALGLTSWRARRERLDPNAVHDLAIWLMTGGFLGARAVFVALHPETVRTFWDLFKIWQGGIVFYGCILGGLIGSLIYWFRHPFPFRPMADVVAPALALGLALGRLGCWLNGCCYGAVSKRPWAVRFPAGSPAWVRHVNEGLIPPFAPCSLPVHPTQLYSALDGLILLGLLTLYYPRRRRDGEVMALLMVAYAVTRFLVESLRADERAVFAGLTLSQHISLALLASGLAFWWDLARRPPGRYADAVSRGDSLSAPGVDHPQGAARRPRSPVG